MHLDCCPCESQRLPATQKYNVISSAFLYTTPPFFFLHWLLDIAIHMFECAPEHKGTECQAKEALNHPKGFKMGSLSWTFSI